jgi:hypothetical protein
MPSRWLELHRKREARKASLFVLLSDSKLTYSQMAKAAHLSIPRICSLRRELGLPPRTSKDSFHRFNRKLGMLQSFDAAHANLDSPTISDYSDFLNVGELARITPESEFPTISPSTKLPKKTKRV